MARILALDYGLKRTGIAVTDELQMIASGLTTVLTSELFAFLTSYLKNELVELIVIGEPKQLNNLPSESKKYIDAFIEKFKLNIPNIPIKRIDERFTSKMALQSLHESGFKKKHKHNKALIDEISATIILQSYLYNK